MWQPQKALLLEKRVKVQSLWRLGHAGEKKSGANFEFKILQAIERNIERHIILPLALTPAKQNTKKTTVCYHEQGVGQKSLREY